MYAGQGGQGSFRGLGTETTSRLGTTLKAGRRAISASSLQGGFLPGPNALPRLGVLSGLGTKLGSSSLAKM